MFHVIPRDLEIFKGGRELKILFFFEILNILKLFGKLQVVISKVGGKL